MTQKITFNGTIHDLSTFLKAYVIRHNVPGFGSKCPQFIAKEPDIELILDTTKLARFHVWRDLNTPEILEVIASLLPNKTTLITVTAIRDPQWTRVRFEHSVVKIVWESILSEMAEQDWLVEKISQRSKDPELQQLQRLRRILNDSLSLSDVRDLCFDLGLNFENLGQATLNGAVRELIIDMQKQGRLEALIEACRQIRPNLDL